MKQRKKWWMSWDNNEVCCFKLTYSVTTKSCLSYIYLSCLWVNILARCFSQQCEQKFHWQRRNNHIVLFAFFENCLKIMKIHVNHDIISFKSFILWITSNQTRLVCLRVERIHRDAHMALVLRKFRYTKGHKLDLMGHLRSALWPAWHQLNLLIKLFAFICGSIQVYRVMHWNLFLELQYVYTMSPWLWCNKLMLRKKPVLRAYANNSDSLLVSFFSRSL